MSTQEGLLGIRERFISKEETTYGTAIALTTAEISGYNIIITPRFSQGFQEKLSAGLDTRTRSGQVKGPLSLEYDHVYYPANWSRLKYMFNIDSETGSSTYTHTLSIGNTQKSFTSEWAIRHSTSPIIFKLTGNVVTQLAIRWSKSSAEGNEGFITCSESIISQDFTTPSLQAGTFEATGEPFQYRHAKMTLASGEIIELNNGELTFVQGINASDSRYCSTSLDRTIGKPISTVFRISGRANVNLVDSTYADIWELADALSGTNTIEFEQSSTNKVTFTLTGAYINPVPVGETNLEGINSADIVFTADSVVPVVIDSIENY
jgi:hypothetical protein